MSFLPGIGGLAGLGGIVAAPFTGGASLALTAGSAAQNAAYVQGKKTKAQPATLESASANASINSTPDFLRISTTYGKLFYGGIALLGIAGIIWFVKKR
jgi:hypothetical protein